MHTLPGPQRSTHTKASAVLDRQPAKQAGIDLQRLADLRDRHRRLIENYRRAGVAVQQAEINLAGIRNAASVDPKAAQALSQSADELARLTAAQLEKLQIHPRTVQLVRAGLARIARLSQDRKTLSKKLTESSRFTSRLEEYARAHGL
jgi:hypothetical protein